MKIQTLTTSLVLAGALALCTPAAADDYYVYANWNPGISYTTGINGFLDVYGSLGAACEEYLILTGGPSYEGAHTAYIYRVTTAGDPDTHPNNPNNTGPMGNRSFALVSSHAMTEYPAGAYYAGHENAFFVDTTGIFYGASRHGIYKWDFNWAPQGWIISTSPGVMQSATRSGTNPTQWWVGDASRNLYRWNGASWALMFTHPDLAGSHHDGMEIIGDSLYVSDMTSDAILQYRLDGAGNPIDPPTAPYKRFNYSAGPPVEGLGFGPNSHIWVAGYSSFTIYELGGGSLQQSINPEICNGVDDDCDGEIDEGNPGSGEDCDTGLPSICAAGLTTCENGAIKCVPKNTGGAEICNAIDDDCDGIIDDGLSRDCSTICGPGTEYCQMGSWVNCTGPEPTDEVCDNLDNDCDGTTDEGLFRACATACGPGQETCRAGQWVDCDAIPPEPEICDGMDNNCDGRFDEGCDCIPDSMRECGEDRGACETGTQVCDANGAWGECVGAVGPTDELCDGGVDNDCDGEVDEGCICVAGETRACGVDVGACVPGLQVCDITGNWGDCHGSVGPLTEVCDCQDNDCDGAVDEGAEICGTSGSTCVGCRCTEACQFGECQAGLICEGGFCVPAQCASDAECDATEVCYQGRCLPSCDGVTCNAGFECRFGECVTVDCGVTGCPEGQVCVNQRCQPNPCAGVSCPAGQFCRDGECLPSCIDVHCNPGQRCEDGQCRVNPCAACDPITEICSDDTCLPIDQDPCTGVNCPSGLLCEAGDCVPEPCTQVGCPAGQACKDGQCTYGDLDGDGLTDDVNPDVDGDGIDNGQDTGPGGDDRSRDHDNDGTDDTYDADDDDDGIADGIDQGPGGEDRSRDHDNDGTDDAVDPDDDGDGIADVNDKGPDGEDYSYDHDNDGSDDMVNLDDDNDGVLDGQDRGPDGDDRSRDHDNDGTDDAADGDDDNDGIADTDDHTEDGDDRSHDHDNDGQVDADDPDDDQDGIPDLHDVGDNGEDLTRDTDNDGIDNIDDPDDDGDDIPDELDSEPLTPAEGGGGESGDSSNCASAAPGSMLPALLLLLGLMLAVRRSRRPRRSRRSRRD